MSVQAATQLYKLFKEKVKDLDDSDLNLLKSNLDEGDTLDISSETVTATIKTPRVIIP